MFDEFGRNKGVIEAIKDTYQAVFDSKVPFSLPMAIMRHSVVFLKFLQVKWMKTASYYSTVGGNKYIYSKLRDGKNITRWNTPEGLSTDYPLLLK